MTPLLAALTAMAVLAGVLLVIAGLRPAPVLPAPTRPAGRSRRSGRVRARLDGLTPRTRGLLAAGAIAGLAMWLTTGWAVAVLILPAAAAGLPALLTSPASTSIDRLEAMEEWTRNLAGVLTAGVGLEQAILATVRSTPTAIAPQVATLVARLRARWGTAAALREFAEDLNDATGDLIASSLLLGAERRGAGLASVLEGLAATVADDVRIRRSIEADRAKPRATARWITLITAGALVLFSFNVRYVAPYGTPLGQLILTLLLTGYVLALLWMRQIARGVELPRFLGPRTSTSPDDAGPGGGARRPTVAAGSGTR